MRETAARLESLRCSRDALAYAFRGEMYFSNGALALVERKGMGSLANGNSTNFSLLLSPRAPLLYKGNKTRRLFADSLREAINHIDADAASLARYRERQVADIHGNFRYNPENIIGRILLAIVTPTWSSLVRAHASDHSRVSAHQALLAALAYQRDHGSPPRTLDQLIPDYLVSVPQDHATHQPIRYDAELGAIWSAGETDLIVATPNQEKKRNEIILWLSPARPTPSTH